MKRLLLFALLLLLPKTLWAHEVGLSHGTYTVTADALAVELSLARRDAAAVVPALDPDRDGSFDERDLARERTAFDTWLRRQVSVVAAHRSCRPEPTQAALAGGDGVMLAARYVCPGNDQSSLRVDLDFFESLPRGHRHVAQVGSGTTARQLLLAEAERTFEVQVAPAPEVAGSPHSRVGFLKLGFEHVLIGIDHLLFLLALVLGGGRLRALIGIVTAFTVGHSLSLALAVLGVWTPAARFVEPGIALSIAYVAVENFFVQDPEKRWRIALPFGLLHGFGFAGALLELDLSPQQVLEALLFFNAGVELAQVAVLSVVVPLTVLALMSPRVPRATTLALNATILMVGVYWFVERVWA